MCWRSSNVVVLSAFALVACTTTGSASISGPIAGRSYVIRDAVSAVYTVSDSATGSNWYWGVIEMSTNDDLCTEFTANYVRPDEQRLTIGIYLNAGTITPIAPDTYRISNAGYMTNPDLTAEFDAEVLDSTCTPIAADSSYAQSGTVSLASINGDAFDGELDVTMTTGEQITGSFHPQACPAINSPQFKGVDNQALCHY
jgi:hypothetical protein